MSGRGASDGALAARFGAFGGRYVPETVIAALDELEGAYLRFRDDVAFRAELEGLLDRYVGRPTPLYRARGLEQAYGVERLYLKREDLCHTGAHKINNALGQVLLASRMGKRRIIAETGAGQHGVATATAAALLGLECCVYMGRVDMAPPAPERDPHADARRRGAAGGLRASGRSRTPSTRRSATGSPTWARRTTSSARPRARPPTRRSWPSSSP